MIVLSLCCFVSSVSLVSSVSFVSFVLYHLCIYANPQKNALSKFVQIIFSYIIVVMNHILKWCYVC